MSPQTQEEKDILQYIENQNLHSIEQESETIASLQNAVQMKYSRRRPVSLRILESDIEKIRARALEEGIPYQTLMSSILHKYSTGKLVER